METGAPIYTNYIAFYSGGGEGMETGAPIFPITRYPN